MEMMGTLAIMGIIAVTGIWMYRRAMDSWYASQLIDQAQRRAVEAAGQITMQGRTNPYIGSFTENEFSGGTFATTAVTEGLYQQFGIQVSNVPKNVCQNILKAIGESTSIRRLSFESDPTSALSGCRDDNTFLMVYNNDMSTSKDTTYTENNCGCQTVCGVCVMEGEQKRCVNECPSDNRVCQQNSDCPGSCVGCVKEANAESGTCQACRQVEYLESTEDQYIDTGISPTNDTGINITYSYPSFDGSSAGICGNYQSGNRGTLFVSSYSGKIENTHLGL